MNKDILEELFKSMPDQETSANFTKNLMQAIDIEKVKAEKRAGLWSMVALITATVGMIGVGVYYLIASVSKAPQLPSFQINWSAYQFPMMIGITMVLLLLGDYWLRRRFTRKHSE